MLKEALEYLIGRGTLLAPSVVKADAEPAHVYYLRKPDGSLEARRAEQPPCNHTANDMDAIVAFAQKINDDKQLHIVWYSVNGVKIVFGEGPVGYKRDRCSITFIESDQLKLIRSWKELRPKLTQQQLTTALKTTLHDSPASASLAAVLSRVKFTSGATIDATIGHGKASLGKEITGEVTGTAAIPEEVKFNVPLFANSCLRHLRADIACAIVPDAESGTFSVVPLPGEIENAVDGAVSEIGSVLRNAIKDAMVLHGAP